VSIHAFKENRLRTAVVWKANKYVRIALIFLVMSALVSDNRALGQTALGPDFDPLGLLEETQRRRESIAAGTFGHLFNLVPEQTIIDYADWNIDLARETGLTYLVYYASAGQFGSQGPPQNETGNGNTNVLIGWKPTWQSGPNQGGFIFHYLNVGQYGTSGVDFAQSLGINSFTSDSSSNTDLFRAVAWRQLFADGLVDFRIGQLEPTTLFNALPYANDNRAFLASPLSNEASRTVPAAGVGMTLIAEVLDDVFLGGAIADAKGKGEFLDFNSFFQGDHMGSAYVAFEPEVGCLGRGKYQFGAHFIEATDTASYSRFVGINALQPLGESWDVFAKYNRADKRTAAIRQSAGGGLVRKGALGFQEDLIGIGFAWAEPSDSTLRDEYVLETFWRTQLTPLIQLTPSLQFWFDPSMTPGEDFQSVFSIRLLGEF
jgi:porin